MPGIAATKPNVTVPSAGRSRSGCSAATTRTFVTVEIVTGGGLSFFKKMIINQAFFEFVNLRGGGIGIELDPIPGGEPELMPSNIIATLRATENDFSGNSS